MLLGALDSLACVQDTVVGVDLFRGIVVHVAHVALVVDANWSSCAGLSACGS